MTYTNDFNSRYTDTHTHINEQAHGKMRTCQSQYRSTSITGKGDASQNLYRSKLIPVNVAYQSKSVLVKFSTGQSQCWSKSTPGKVNTGRSQYWSKLIPIKVNTIHSSSQSIPVKVNRSESLKHAIILTSLQPQGC